MKKKLTLVSVFLAACSAAVAQGPELKIAAICSGAATLDNGSVVTIGQPFVGMMSAPGESVAVSSGLLPALLQTKSVSGPLAIIPAAFPVTGRFQFCFPTQPGRNYIIQASTNLSIWTPIWTNAGNWTGLTYEDADAALYPWRFYRVGTP